MTSTILLPENSSISAGRARQLDLSIGSQQGALLNPKLWMSSATYVQQRIIPVLVSVPGLMKYMPDADHRKRILRTLMTTTAKSITGLNSTLSVAHEEVVIGNSGDMHDVLSGVSRERSTPSYTWDNRLNAAITHYWEQYIEYLLMQADAHIPLVTTLDAYINDGSPEITPDDISFTMLFIEPSMNMNSVVRSWLCTNMMPKSSGEITGQRVMGGNLEVKEVSIDFTATTQSNDSTNELATSYLRDLNKYGFNARGQAAAYDSISSALDVDGDDYKANVAEVANSI